MSYELVQETAIDHFGENITVVYAPEKVCWIVESWPSGGIIGFITWMNGTISAWNAVLTGKVSTRKVTARHHVNIDYDAAGGDLSTNMLDQLLLKIVEQDAN